MCSTKTDIVLEINQYDPTRTLTLRNVFVRDFNRRFRELEQVVVIAIVNEDVLGLIEEPIFVAAQELTTPGIKAFDFPRSQDKVEGFMRWFERQSGRALLESTEFQQIGEGVETAWTNQYISDSYKRGVQRARYELRKAGFNVPSIGESGGAGTIMNNPFHVDRLGLLYSRVFTELRGVNATMDRQISQVLTQGIADGDNPRLLARKLRRVINGVGPDKLGLDISYIHPTTGRQVSYFMSGARRAEILARTEIIRAHHQAMIQEYKNWKVEGVIVKAEWLTAGDKRVCSECEGLEGEVFPLEVINNMIPKHPQCRCVALPFKE
jgi:SPP1 gp7 family putative phage head morphogenesis protein